MSDVTLQMPRQYIVKGDLEALKTWAAKGGDLLDRFDNQETLLHKACFNGQLDIVRFLLENGLTVAVRDKQDFRPLHEAARNGQLNVVQALLAAGADPDAKTTSGKTAEELATDKGAAKVVEWLKFARLKPVWVRTDEAEISHVAYKQGLGYRVTEIFNFRAESYLAVIRNMEAGTESAVFKTFDELRGSRLVEEARLAFQGMGGALPETDATLDKPKPGLKPGPTG